MTKYKEVDYKVRKSWLPLWLIPLLVVILIILIAVFIFVYTLDSKKSCIFGCEHERDHIATADQIPRDDVVIPPTKNKTVFSGPLKNPDQKTKQEDDMIEITGKLLFQDGVPDYIPPGSYLKVKFEDTSRMDAPSVLLGEAEVDLSNYKKEDGLTYTIKCKRPSHSIPFGDSVSAVLNIGWTPSGNHWIRKGDYHTDTHHGVEIEDEKVKYSKDIMLVRY